MKQMYQTLGVSPEVYEYGESILQGLKERFEAVDAVAEFGCRGKDARYAFKRRRGLSEMARYIGAALVKGGHGAVQSLLDVARMSQHVGFFFQRRLLVFLKMCVVNLAAAHGQEIGLVGILLLLLAQVVEPGLGVAPGLIGLAVCRHDGRAFAYGIQRVQKEVGLPHEQILVLRVYVDKVSTERLQVC